MQVDGTLVLLILSGFEVSVNLTEINYITSATAFSYEKTSFYNWGDQLFILGKRNFKEWHPHTLAKAHQLLIQSHH